MNKKRSTNLTLFRKEAEEYQEKQKRTKSAGLQEGLLFAGVSAISLIIIVLVRVIFGGLPDIMLLVIPVLIIGFLVGLYRIIISLFRSEKKVTCPKCNTVHEIFKKERLYLCTECWTLLRMGADTEAPFRFINCEYCGHQAAVTDDHGEFTCPNCGIRRSLTGAVVDRKTIPCPNCEESVPQKAVYCIHCEQILRTLTKYSKDWEIGKDGHGHIHFARMLLTTFPAKAAELDRRFREDNPRTGKQPWPNTFDEMPPMLTLGKALRSLEEALQDPKLRSTVEGLLPEIDLLYAKLLVLELKMILWAEGPDNVPLAVRIEDNRSPLDVFEDGPHIQARKRIEKILGPKSLQSSGSIGPWKDQSLTSRRSESFKNYLGEMQFSDILSSYSGLVSEALRFAEWAKQNGYSLELLDAALEIKEITSARKKDEKPVSVAPSIAGEKVTVEAVEAPIESVVEQSRVADTPKKIISPDKIVQSRKKLGWILVIVGVLISAIGLCLFAPFVMQLSDNAGVRYSSGEIIKSIGCCPTPVLLFGLLLILGGFFSHRSAKKMSDVDASESSSERSEET